MFRIKVADALWCSTKHRDYARAMRKDSTRAENILWQALRNHQLQGFKFKRQVPLEGYILDFVCMETRLIIEVDGGQHSGSSRDEIRDAHFTALNFTILRFWNHEIEQNIDAACRHVLQVIGTLRSNSPHAGENGIS